MYALFISHQKKCFVKGDSSTETIIEDVLHYKRLIDAQTELLSQINRMKAIYPECQLRKAYVPKSSEIKSRTLVFTGKTWFDETVGDTQQEMYSFAIKKL